MKIFRIFFSCFIALYAITIIWIGDDNVLFKPLIWLIINLTFVVLIIAGMIFFTFWREMSPKYLTILQFCLSSIYIGYICGYKEILHYKNETYAVKYGIAFNTTRKLLGVPLLPASWHVKVRPDGGIIWSKGKNGPVGHVSKQIDINSASRLDSEDDYYFFKQGSHRDLIISTYYGNNGRLDSIVYYYSKNYTGHNISKQQADSILDAENMRKIIKILLSEQQDAARFIIKNTINHLHYK